MEIYSPIEAIRKNSGYFLKGHLAADRSIALSLMETAITDGVSSILAESHEGYFLIFTKENWVTRFHRESEYTFKLTPLAGMQNTFRGEILLEAFCEHYAFFENGECLYANKVAENDHIQNIIESRLKDFLFCIAFRVKEQGRW